MAPKVILKTKIGANRNQSFVVADKTKCLIGRASDCSLQVLGVLNMVSRHHCLLDVNLPDIRVRDLGSLNGTYINDELIGRRSPYPGLGDDTLAIAPPEHCLRNGDRLQVGEVTFDVQVSR